MRAFASATALMAFCVAPVFYVAPAWAHGPTRQKVNEAIVIDKPADQVWSIIKNFGDLSKWHPLVASSVADKGNEEGSTRTVVLKGDGSPTFKEVLDKYDPANRSYKYEIDKVDPNILPVNDYTSTITVLPNGKDSSIVMWKGAFYRGYMLNDPPPNLNDRASVGAVVQVYRAGLENLKSIAELAR